MFWRRTYLYRYISSCITGGLHVNWYDYNLCAVKFLRRASRKQSDTSYQHKNDLITRNRDMRVMNQCINTLKREVHHRLHIIPYISNLISQTQIEIKRHKVGWFRAAVGIITENATNKHQCRLHSRKNAIPKGHLMMLQLDGGYRKRKLQLVACTFLMPHL